MTRYVLSADSLQDLDEIWEYIAADSVDAADRWIATLFEAFENLVRNPGIGHARPDLTDRPIRFWTVGAYLILYRQQNAQIQIIAVAQGSREIPLLLRRR